MFPIMVRQSLEYPHRIKRKFLIGSVLTNQIQEFLIGLVSANQIQKFLIGFSVSQSDLRAPDWFGISQSDRGILVINDVTGVPSC